MTGVIRTDGNNYVAEAAALVCTLVITPVNYDLTAHIDSTAVIGGSNPQLVSDRRRQRKAARPLINLARRIINFRRATGVDTEIVHVKAHTGNHDTHSVFNDIADSYAKDACSRGEAMQPRDYFLAGEERVVVFHSLQHVHGDLRKTLKKAALERHIVEWGRRPHQGRVARNDRRVVLEFCQRIMRHWDGEFTRFMLTALCEWLPVEHRLNYDANEVTLTTDCKLCLPTTKSANGGHTPIPETCRHVFRCPANKEELANVHSQVALLLRGKIKAEATAAWQFLGLEGPPPWLAWFDLGSNTPKHLPLHSSATLRKVMKDTRDPCFLMIDTLVPWVSSLLH